MISRKMRLWISVTLGNDSARKQFVKDGHVAMEPLLREPHPLARDLFRTLGGRALVLRNGSRGLQQKRLRSLRQVRRVGELG